MTTKEINAMPIGKQFALVAHLYKLEIIELSQLCGRWFTEVAMAAGRIFYELGTYHKHRQVPRHR